MLESLMYVSTSTLDPPNAERVVRALAGDSIARNEELGITGALIFTGTHFVQIFEGETVMVETLLRSLRTDGRHKDMIIIERGPLAARRFPGWRIAYAGPSHFIGRQVSRALNSSSPAEMQSAADWLTNLMREFVAE